ncbi:MAG: phenylalanine--tRNA ligase subunit beta [Janthinobacterium lividum]
MKFTLSWLKEHLETTASLDQITDRLTANGLVVDSLTHRGAGLNGFKIVEIVEALPHPKADRLQVCRVNTGSDIIQVVCGAPNARAGLRTVLASPGLIIPTSRLVIRQSTIRDVESQGMLCSERELGLSDAHTGILELDSEAPIGTEFAAYHGLDDPIIDIEITPNRGDCLSIRGIARDLAATGIGTLKPISAVKVPSHFASSIDVEIENTQDCPLYLGRIIKNVKNGPSPLWLQKKLKSVGLKSISRLVDVTNLMMIERGQPMHVFDADQLQGSLIVRTSHERESFDALNDESYTICSGAIVIVDDQGPCCLGGIMGGKASSCSEETTNVFLESALFDAVRTAQTGQKMNILSDSRYRFERGVDGNIAEEVLEQATQLIITLCGGEASEIIRAGDPILASSKRSVHFRPERVQSLGGLSISDQTSFDILNKLGFKEIEGEDQVYEIPSWRPDIKGEADLVEEILRIHGYDHITKTPLPLVTPQERLLPNLDSQYSWQRIWQVQRALVARGHAEAYTWSFLRHEWAQHFGGGQSELVIRNPISVDMSDMRPSLLPLLLEALDRNIRRGQDDGALFEIGKQYLPDKEVLMASGLRGYKTSHAHWAETGRAVDAFDAKADVEAILESVGFDPASAQVLQGAPSWYHPGRSGTIRLGPQLILAHFGEFHPQTLKMFNLDKAVVGFEVFLDAVPFAKNKMRFFDALSPYQAVERDFAFLIDRDISAAKLIQLIQKANKSLIKSVTIFDVYQGKGVPENKKSVGVRIRLEPQEATLSDADITAVSQVIIDTTHTQLGAVLRS